MKTTSINQRKLKKNLFLASCLTIPIVHWFVFWLYAHISAFIIPFQNLAGDWVGWANFEWYFTNLFSDHPQVDMALAIRNTLFSWLFGRFVSTPLMLAFAYFFYKKIAGYKVYRIITYLPSIIGSMVMVSAFKGVIRSGGPLDLIIQKLGGDPIPKLLYDSRYAFTTCLIYELWDGFGTGLIMYAASMNRIPQEVVEYAYLDGVNAWQEFIHITFPLIWPLFSMSLILSVGDIFTASSGPVFFLTGGGYGTINIAYSMFAQVFYYQQTSRAAAIGMIFTIIAIPLVVLTRWLCEKVRDTEEY